MAMKSQFMKSKFAGKCERCRIPFGPGIDIEWKRGAGATHATVQQCTDAMNAQTRTLIERPVLDLKPIVKFLQAAQDRGLKRPKLRVLGTDGFTEMRIGLTTRGQAPGSISVSEDKHGFLGCVRPNGEMTSVLALDTVLQKHLLRISENPAAAAKEYAALMCKCSFCGLPLTDAGSVEVGYGPVCAKHWGLPHVPFGTPILHPVV